MTDELKNAVIEIAKIISSVEGMRHAPPYPPEIISETPFAVTYVLSGAMEISSEGSRHKLFEIAIDLLVKRNVMSKDVELLLPFLDIIPDVLSAEISTIGGNNGTQFNASIETFRGVAIEFIPEYVYQNVVFIGYRFTMQGVKFIQGD